MPTENPAICASSPIVLSVGDDGRDLVILNGAKLQ